MPRPLLPDERPRPVIQPPAQAPIAAPRDARNVRALAGAPGRRPHPMPARRPLRPRLAPPAPQGVPVPADPWRVDPGERTNAMARALRQGSGRLHHPRSVERGRARPLPRGRHASRPERRSDHRHRQSRTRRRVSPAKARVRLAQWEMRTAAPCPAAWAWSAPLTASAPTSVRAAPGAHLGDPFARPGYRRARGGIHDQPTRTATGRAAHRSRRAPITPMGGKD